MVRTPCCKAELGIKKGAWTSEEDEKLISYVKLHGEGGWRTLPEKAGLKRCGKSCRLRWANYLRPDIKRGEFTEDEERSIISLHVLHGNKWSAIARELPGRTDNEIKNYWNTHIKKRLIKKGIDPVTHKGLICSTTDISESLPEKQNISVSTTSNDDPDNNEKTKKDNKKSGLSSIKLLNRVANRFGKRINHSVLSEIIISGGPLTSHTSTTTTISVTVDSESYKSTNSPFTPTTDLPNQMVVDDNINVTYSSSTFSESSINDRLMYCDNEDNIGFSSFPSDEDFMVLDESCVENTEFLKELRKFLQEDENNFTDVTPVYEHQDIFLEVDKYFA